MRWRFGDYNNKVIILKVKSIDTIVVDDEKSQKTKNEKDKMTIIFVY